MTCSEGTTLSTPEMGRLASVLGLASCRFLEACERARTKPQERVQRGRGGENEPMPWKRVTYLGLLHARPSVRLRSIQETSVRMQLVSICGESVPRERTRPRSAPHAPRPRRARRPHPGGFRGARPCSPFRRTAPPTASYPGLRCFARDRQKTTHEDNENGKKASQHRDRTVRPKNFATSLRHRAARESTASASPSWRCSRRRNLDGCG